MTTAPPPADSSPVPDAAADHALAAELAAEVAAALMGLRAELAATGVSGREMGAAGDRMAHELIMATLARRAPDDAVLSEEGADDRRRLDHRRVWVVDPLDGTREFGEIDRTDWAVHIALTVDGQPTAAAVALPALGEVLATPNPQGAQTDGADTPLRIVVSRSRPPAEAEALAEALGAELVPMGSAGAKTMAVVRGQADVYVHAGGQYEWDSCAPVGVARAAGLHTSRIDGSPLVYNRPSPWLPDLVVCRPELAAAVLAVVAPGSKAPDSKAPDSKA